MILDNIVNENLKELEERKQLHPVGELEKAAFTSPQPLDFAKAISGAGIRLIAEVKKASPSRGIIRDDIDPIEIARTYAPSGASAISVLTEPRYFQGSLNNLKRIRNALLQEGIPILRKDFLSDRYQILESRAYGADAVLLITAILTPERLKELINLSHALGMACLVEVHDEKELDMALESGAGIIGINNRDLTTFKVDVGTTSKLRGLIPGDRIVVSESGIRSRKDIEALEKIRVNAVLIGEALMTSQDIRSKIKELGFDENKNLRTSPGRTRPIGIYGRSRLPGTCVRPEPATGV